MRSWLSAILKQHGWILWVLAAGVFLLFIHLPPALRWPARALWVLLCLMAVSSLVWKVMQVLRRPKKMVFMLLTLAFSAGLCYGCLELLSWVYVRSHPDLNVDPLSLTALQRESIGKIIRNEKDYQMFSPSLGWTIRPDSVSNDGLYRSNAMGFRADRAYPAQKPAGVTRVLCFGDSFTHGQEVKNDETWEHQAEAADRSLEFLNFGVGGYGLTQAYVRYRETAPQYQTDFVIIGFMTHDVRRTVNAYYPFRFSNPAEAPSAVAMPYASLDAAGELQILPPALADRKAYEDLLASPRATLRKLAKIDILFTPRPATPFLFLLHDRLGGVDFQHFAEASNYCRLTWTSLLGAPSSPTQRSGVVAAKENPFLPESRIFEINAQLFSRFAEDVKKSGATPLVLWFPSPDDVGRYNEGRPKIYRGFLNYFSGHHLECMDLLDWLATEYQGSPTLPSASIFGDAHFSPDTNRRLGKHLANWVRHHAPAETHPPSP